MKSEEQRAVGAREIREKKNRMYDEIEKTRFDASRDTPHISHHPLMASTRGALTEVIQAPPPESERHNSIEQQPAHAKYVTK